MSNTRREFLKQGANITALSALGLSAGCETRQATSESGTSKTVEWPVQEGPRTPKICTGISRNADVESMRSMKQIGVDYVLMVQIG